MVQLADKENQENLGAMRHEGKYLTFSMGPENYGIGVRKVKEIIGMIPITSVPQTPDFFKGVINLRGKVIPVMDLRIRFGMERAEYTERACIVMVEVPGKVSTQLVGVVVDAVSEVVNIKGEDIEETPSFGTNADSDYILGLAKISGDVKILLDIDRTLCTEQMNLKEITVSEFQDKSMDSDTIKVAWTGRLRCPDIYVLSARQPGAWRMVTSIPG